MREKPGESEDIVKFKPLYGIRPGIYLTALYSLILLLILFFLLVYPGLKNPGSLLVVKTEPYGAAIRVDDIYMGTASGASAAKIFVPRGEHTIQAVLPGFESETAVHQIPGRVFGSRFFPLRYHVEFTLKTKDAAAAFAQAAAEFAEWTFMGEPTVAWQIPLSLCEGAYRAGPALGADGADIVKASARFASTRAALRDLIRAKILVDSGGLSPSPAGLAKSISDILAFLSENSESAAWLSGLLPPESAAIIKESAWKSEHSLARHIVPGADITAPFARQMELSGLRFAGAGEGYLRGGQGSMTDIIKITHIKPFMLSERPVPRSVYENFLTENPEWKDEQNNVFEQDTDAGEITAVSWFAAVAFCEWLTKRLPSSMTAAGLEIRLPMENEFEYAELSGILNPASSDWEWCADPYSPLEFSAPENGVNAVSSPERSLRGKAPSQQRASLPPELPSPSVTFRPVIAEK